MSTLASDMQSNVRLYIGDTSSTAQTFSNAQLRTWLNLALLWWFEGYERKVKYATLVTQYVASSYFNAGDATALYPEILDVSWDIFSAPTPGLDNQLRPLPWEELAQRIYSESSVGTPSHYAKIKIAAPGVAASTQNKWRFAVWPPPTVDIVLRGIVRDWPTQLSADGDVVDLGDYEARCVEIIASIIASRRMGRPELGEDLMGMLPQMMQAKLQAPTNRMEVKP